MKRFISNISIRKNKIIYTHESYFASHVIYEFVCECINRLNSKPIYNIKPILNESGLLQTSFDRLLMFANWWKDHNFIFKYWHHTTKIMEECRFSCIPSSICHRLNIWLVKILLYIYNKIDLVSIWLTENDKFNVLHNKSIL